MVKNFNWHTSLCVTSMSLMLMCNCDVNAIMSDQSSAVSSQTSQLVTSQLNSNIQNSSSSASNGIMSQNSFTPSSATTVVPNTTTGNVADNTLVQSSQQQLTTENQTIKHRSSSQKRTCLEAMQSSLNNGVSDNYCILDLSNTSDFAQNADLVTQQFFSQIQSSGIKHIYVDLYNSSVSDTYISKWSAQLKQSGMKVLWNLSGNKTVSDQTITLLGSLDNVTGLNIAGTSVTDAGATQLVTMLSGTNPVCLDFINIYRSRISDSGRAMLEAKFNENKNKWNSSNPDKKIGGRGIINDLELSVDKKEIKQAETVTQSVTAQTSTTANSSLGQSLVNSTTSSINSGTQQPVVASNSVGTTVAGTSPVAVTQTGNTNLLSGIETGNTANNANSNGISTNTSTLGVASTGSVSTVQTY